MAICLPQSRVRERGVSPFQREFRGAGHDGGAFLSMIEPGLIIVGLHGDPYIAQCTEYTLNVKLADIGVPFQNRVATANRLFPVITDTAEG